MTERSEPRVEGFDPSMFESVPLGGFMGSLDFHWDLLSPDRVEAHIHIDERHHQPYGIVHGGVYAAVVETMGSTGAAIHAVPQGMIVVGVSNSTDFLRPHRRGRLDCVGEPIHAGRTQHLWQVVITRPEDAKPVARGQVRLQVLPADRQLAGAEASAAIPIEDR